MSFCLQSRATHSVISPVDIPSDEMVSKPTSCCESTSKSGFSTLSASTASCSEIVATVNCRILLPVFPQMYHRRRISFPLLPSLGADAAHATILRVNGVVLATSP